jgi:transposase
MPALTLVLILDGAGWHVARELKVPANITLHHLPAYSPELNPVERLWAYLRSHYLSNRVYEDYNELFDETSKAWNRLDETTLASITDTGWVRRAN